MERKIENIIKAHKTFFQSTITACYHINSELKLYIIYMYLISVFLRRTRVLAEKQTRFSGFRILGLKLKVRFGVRKREFSEKEYSIFVYN